MGCRCAYGLCNSDARYKEKEYMKGVHFIRMVQPSENLEMCKRWVQACGRQDFTYKRVTRHTYICSKHFVSGLGPTKEHPHPIPLTQTTQAVKSVFKRRSPNKLKKQNTVMNDVRQVQTLTEENNIALDSLNEIDLDEIVDAVADRRDAEVQVNLNLGADKPENRDQGSQTLEPRYMKQLFTQIEKSRATASTIETADFAFYESAKKNPSMFRYFTGLSVESFDILYHEFLKESNMNLLKYCSQGSTPEKISPLRCKLTNADKLYITLMRIRRGVTLQEIAYFVKCSVPLISKITYTWTQFLYFQFHDLRKLMFQDRISQKINTPGCFKRFKKLRVIIDCTEIFIQMPQNFEEQGNTFSSYKHSNTVKFLVGMSVNMGIIFISDGFEGSISDREIFLKSGIMDFLNPGDRIMCDRGYNIQDLLDPMKIKIIQPPMLGNRPCFTDREEMLTKFIARSRVHIERAIGRIKNFKILQPYVPYTLLPTISNIFYVAGCLANFDEDHLV